MIKTEVQHKSCLLARNSEHLISVNQTFFFWSASALLQEWLLPKRCLQSSAMSQYAQHVPCCPPHPWPSMAHAAAPLSHTGAGVHTNTEGSLINPGLAFFSCLSLDSSCYTHRFHQWLNTCVLRWQLCQIWPGHAGGDIQPCKCYYIF